MVYTHKQVSKQMRRLSGYVFVSVVCAFPHVRRACLQRRHFKVRSNGYQANPSSHSFLFCRIIIIIIDELITLCFFLSIGTCIRALLQLFLPLGVGDCHIAGYFYAWLRSR